MSFEEQFKQDLMENIETRFDPVLDWDIVPEDAQTVLDSVVDNFSPKFETLNKTQYKKHINKLANALRLIFTTSLSI